MKFTVGQEKAINAIWALVSNPKEKFLIIEGPAGTGKSEIIKEIVKNFHTMMKSITRLTNDNNLVYQVKVTATTNKAVDALLSKGIEQYMQEDKISTIYSVLKLRPLNGKLVRTTDTVLRKCLILVDESSFINQEMLEYLDTLTDDTCKIVLIGDPYQLPPVKLPNSPIYDQGIDTISLDEVMRNTGSIQKLSLDLREFVKGADMPALIPDNDQLFLIKDEDEFIDIWLDKIKSGESTKLICYENNSVHIANSIAKEELENRTVISEGDILVCNQYVAHPTRQIKTDTEVVVTSLRKDTSLGYPGHYVGLNLGITVFVPDNPETFSILKSAALSREEHNFFTKRWADLRPHYSCTIHKSQGSTYKNVFINLNELQSITDDNDLSRLLYVAVSRASHRVYFTGTL